MGSKNLKAVAVRGHKRLETKDPDKLKELARWFAQNLKASPGAVSRRTYGTGECMIPMSVNGTLPTRNFRESSFEFAEDISGETMKDTILVGTDGCYACSMRCKRIVRTKGLYETDPLYGGPEYETLAGFGSLCGTRDLNAICVANQICNAYSMDTISTACVVAFAIGCFENGIITPEDTEGLKLEFGNPGVVLRLIEMIARRKGIGGVLAEGVSRASDKIGKGSVNFALHVKGKEIPMEDPRGLTGVGLQYALSPSGADHMQAPDDSVFEQNLESIKPLDIVKRVDRLDIGSQKGRAIANSKSLGGLSETICSDCTNI
jgi:aldehyde:ferredoxin oxidoreductase